VRRRVVTALMIIFLAASAVTVAGMAKAAQITDDQAAKARGVAHYIMGVSYDLLGMSSAALQEYRGSAKGDPDSFAPHLRLGVAYAHEGRYREAVIELTRAVTVDPKDLQAHYYLALVYSSLNDFVKAAEQYEVILKKLSLEEPRNAELFVYLGQLYYSQGQEGRAIEQFEKVLKIDPKNTGVMLMVAMYYIDHDRRKEGIELLEKCTKQDPMDDSCLNSLSYMYAEDNVNLDEAYRFVQNALKIDPENPAYLDTLGWVYYRKGMYNESLKELSRAEALLVDPTIYGHLAEVYTKLNQPEMAKKYWGLSIQAEPERPDIKSKVGIFEKGLPQLFSPKQD
jgi:tetratricopeptide (TPR) repeat protein